MKIELQAHQNLKRGSVSAHLPDGRTCCCKSAATSCPLKIQISEHYSSQAALTSNKRLGHPCHILAELTIPRLQICICNLKPHLKRSLCCGWLLSFGSSGLLQEYMMLWGGGYQKTACSSCTATLVSEVLLHPPSGIHCGPCSVSASAPALVSLAPLLHLPRRCQSVQGPRSLHMSASSHVCDVLERVDKTPSPKIHLFSAMVANDCRPEGGSRSSRSYWACLRLTCYMTASLRRGIMNLIAVHRGRMSCCRKLLILVPQYTRI